MIFSEACWAVVLVLHCGWFGVGLLGVLAFGRESGLPPLWPKSEKEPIRNSIFYISVDDF